MIRRPLTVLAAALTVAVSAGLGVTAPAAIAQTSNCGDVILIGARGSGEKWTASGLGPTISHVADRLRSALVSDGETMDSVPIPYPALGTDLLFPKSIPDVLTGSKAWRSRVSRWLAGLDDGIQRMKAAIREQAQICPDSDLVIAGYSQGAMVAHQAEVQLSDAGDEALDNVAGTILIADGDRAPNSKTTVFGGAPTRSEGIRPWARLIGIRDVFDPESTVQVCGRYDPICDFTFSRVRRARSDGEAIHGYVRHNVGLLDKATDWFADEILGLGPPGNVG